MNPITTVPARNRIVIGDVGSGKTIVGFFVALGFLHGLDITQGFGQVAIVAPTEILASQHYHNLIKLLNKLSNDSVVCILVTAKSYFIDGEKYTKSKFENHLKQLTDKHIMWLGTHALFHRDDVQPELVMIDEQHRFGVRQRKELTTRLEGDNLKAHFISFSATPIPRTIALALYHDLQPLFLDRIKQRSKIDTRITMFDHLEFEVIPVIREALSKRRKIYIVCPRIQDDDDSDLWSINQTAQYFKKYFGDTIKTLHGKAKNKDSVLQEFKDSDEHNILVATSVIEVGVDISEATVMVILNAERFGLAALHQIRGRIGRNSYQDNYCILVTNQQGMFSKRLNYILDSQDGFWLAQKDLELRGSGDLTGNIQSGYTKDIELFMNIDQSDLNTIASEVDALDLSNIDTQLPRLKSYLEAQKKDIWAE